jgi:hypothetical protein
MEELLWYVVAPILELLGNAYTEDSRRGARWITLGCGAVVVIAAVVAGLFLLR